MKLYQVSGYQEMCQKAAALLCSQIAEKPNSVLGLATGSTPIGVYKLLVQAHERGEVSFGPLTTFNLDEYCGLGKSDPQSYYYYMNENLFGSVDIDSTRAFIPNGKAEDIAAECAAYEEKITAAGGIDLQILGIGNNGHIAFNEPGEFFEKHTHCVDLDEKTIAANARFFTHPEDVPRRAITMGIKTIFAARKILLLANGAGKKDIMQLALHGPITPKVPASILQLHPDLTVIWSAE